MSARTFFVGEYRRLLSLTVLGLAIATGLGLLVYLRSSDNDYRQLLSESFAPHATELAPELVLKDQRILKDRADFIRSQLALDSVTIQLSENKMVLATAPAGLSKLATVLLRDLVGIRPLMVDVSDGIYLQTARVRLEYLTPFYNERARPIVFAVLWTFLGLIVSLGLVFFFVYSNLMSFLLSPLRRLTSGVEPRDGFRVEEIETLRQALDEKRKLEKSKALMKLAEQVAHDIRAPVLALEVALQGSEFPESEKLLVQRASQRIRSIARALLDGDRQYFGEGRSNLARVSETALAEIQLHPLFSRSGVRLEMFVPNDVTAPISAADLERVLSALLINSLEAVAVHSAQWAAQRANQRVTQQPFLEVRAFRTDESLGLEILDNGPGISPDEKILLGTHPIASMKPDGNGIGCSIAGDLIRRSGGELRFENRPEGGARVTLMWPNSPKNAVGMVSPTPVPLTTSANKSRGENLSTR